MELEGLPENQPADFANEGVHFRIALMARHEDKPLAKLWFDALDRLVKLVAREVGMK